VWLGMAAQLRRRIVWCLALAVVSLVSLSRLALGVHFPGDVAAGLLLGAGFAWVATRPVSRLQLLGAIAFLLALVPALAEYARGLALLAAFMISRFAFTAPRDWPGRLMVGLGGLSIVFAAYFAFRVLPDELRHTGPVSGVRMFVTALVATELVPLLFRRWMPRDVAPRDMATPAAG
jgi:hypothetical protein